MQYVKCVHLTGDWVSFVKCIMGLGAPSSRRFFLSSSFARWRAADRTEYRTQFKCVQLLVSCVRTTHKSLTMCCWVVMMLMMKGYETKVATQGTRQIIYNYKWNLISQSDAQCVIKYLWENARSRITWACPRIYNAYIATFQTYARSKNKKSTLGTHI